MKNFLNRINDIIKSKIYIKFESSNPPSGKKGKSKSLSYLPQKNNHFLIGLLEVIKFMKLKIHQL